MGHFRIVVVLTFLLLLVISGTTVAVDWYFGGPTLPIVIEDEFVGPFTTWTNVQTQAVSVCGAASNATGNGSTDDTAAIQKCLNVLPGSTTLYFPAGTYKISSTLAGPSGTGVFIVGADPTSTTIKWAGAASGTMMTVNSNYSSFRRLTFDGGGTAGIDMQVLSGTNVTNNLYSDLYFKNAGIGLQWGTSNTAVSEQTCLRCQFVNDTTEGLLANGNNTVNLWVWDSYFSSNAIGATQTNSGSFDIYRSTFVTSTSDDIVLGSTNWFESYRDNVSFGSPIFFSLSQFSQAGEIMLQRNRLLDTNNTPIVSNFSGPTELIDNQIRSPSGSSAVAVSAGSSSTFSTVVESIGNTFTTTTGSPISITAGGGSSTRLYEQNDVTSAAFTSIPVSVPTPVPPPPNNNRTICEVASGLGSATIQACINSAAAKGGRTVVHIATGSHSIATSISIPSNSDVQIIGDGWDSGKSALTWTGSTGPMFNCASPCRAWVRDLYISAGTVNAFDIHTEDSAMSRVAINETYAGGSTNCLETDNLSNTTVNALSYTCNRTASTSGSILVNGPGAANNSRVFYAGSTGGQVSTGTAEYQVTSNGNLIGWDTWNEIPGSTPNQVLVNETSKTGNIVLSGGLWAPNAQNGFAGLVFNNFTGQALIDGLAMESNIISDSNNNSGTNLFVAGPLEIDSTSPWFQPAAGGNVFKRGQFNYASGPSATNDADNGSPSAGQVTAAYALLRATDGDQVNTSLGNGVTDFQSQKVWINSSAIAYHVVNP